jgi:hypothetical protein
VHVELGIWILAGATLLAAVIAAAGAVFAALISRENRRKLATPGEGTIGDKMQRVVDDSSPR